LQDAIYQIEHAQGVVKAIDQDSKQLAAALIDGTKIVVTTLQKFPFVLRGLLYAAGAERQEDATPEQKAEAARWEAEIAKRRYAIIVDEAHSSQTGETARELKAILVSTAKTTTFTSRSKATRHSANVSGRKPQACSRKPHHLSRENHGLIYSCSIHEPEVVYGSESKKELRAAPRLKTFRAPRHSGLPRSASCSAFNPLSRAGRRR
jgi:hypothetical protein